MKYVISDLHFNHGNIIEHCGRPFSCVEEMNEAMVEEWRKRVTDDDIVYVLGDVIGTESEIESDVWLSDLPGKSVLVAGNHDTLRPSIKVPVVESCTLSHDGVTFFCSHRPQPDFRGWQLHGHVHNNNIIEHPFIDDQRNLVNVSAEMVQYRPVSLDEIVYYIREHERFETLKSAESRTNR
jgi:calcineurin-like phosphoesterase family protein